MQREAQKLIHESATRLAAMIRRGEVSSYEVTRSHVDQLSQVNPELNALAWDASETALEAARRADRQRAADGPLGPLHGVPVTIKECFHWQGTPACIGVTHLRHELSVANAPLVQRLLDAGAIILGKTNIPQLMISHECDNPVYGRTVNPYDKERTSGGSSGGEAALIATGCSPLGFGSDLGGSIRVPAHFCGVQGLKPTSGRLSVRGITKAMNGMTAIAFQPGPMARCAADLELALKVISQPGESYESELPYANEECKSVDVARLKVGVWHDGAFQASPAIERGLNQAAQVLRDMGADVSPLTPPHVDEAIELYMSVLSADRGHDLRAVLGRSTISPFLRQLLLLGRVPASLRMPVARAYELAGHGTKAQLIRVTRPQDVSHYWRATSRIEQIRGEMEQQFREQRIDALLCVPYALPALRHDTSNELLPAARPAMYANLLGTPCASVPITRVRADETSSRREGRDSMLRLADRTDEGSAGLPVGVQIVGRWWREDIVLAIAKALETASEDFTGPFTPTG